MKIYELLEASDPNSPSNQLRKLKGNKDELIKHILTKVKDGRYDYAKKVVALARDKGIDYPEFDSVEKSIGRGVAGNATHEPSYNEKSRSLQGRVKDWHKLMGVSDKDVATAHREISSSKQYLDLIHAGMTDISTPQQKKNGTFNFSVKDEPGSYQVYGNGQLRHMKPLMGYGGYGRLKHQLVASLRPTIIAGDPVKSLLKTYEAAMEKMLAYFKRARSPK